jgi:hypothetical protein
VHGCCDVAGRANVTATDVYRSSNSAMQAASCYRYSCFLHNSTDAQSMLVATSGGCTCAYLHWPRNDPARQQHCSPFTNTWQQLSGMISFGAANPCRAATAGFSRLLYGKFRQMSDKLSGRNALADNQVRGAQADSGHWCTSCLACPPSPLTRMPLPPAVSMLAASPPDSPDSAPFRQLT